VLSAWRIACSAPRGQWLLSSLCVIRLFLGVEMLFRGWSLVTLTLAAKNLPAEEAA
jgi:hypothetical protein